MTSRLFPRGAWTLLLLGVVRGSNAQAAFLEGRTLDVDLIHRATALTEVRQREERVIVGPEVELEDFRIDPIFNDPSMRVRVDIGDDTILVTLLEDQPLSLSEGLQFFDPSPANDKIDWRDVRVNPATNWAQFETQRASVSGPRVIINVGLLSGLAGQQILLDVVPEPCGASLAGVGLATLAALRRRKGN